MRNKMSVAGALAAAGILCAAAPASAAIVINVIEGPTGVSFEGSGTFDLTGMTPLSPLSAFVTPSWSPSAGDIRIGSTAFIDGEDSDRYLGLSGPASFGTGAGGFIDGFGPVFGVAPTNSGIVLLVPRGYKSGGFISSTGTAPKGNGPKVTFATFGVTAGTSFTWTGPKDTLTVNFLSSAVVPEPSTWMMMILGFGVIARRLRRNALETQAA